MKLGIGQLILSASLLAGCYATFCEAQSLSGSPGSGGGAGTNSSGASAGGSHSNMGTMAPGNSAGESLPNAGGSHLRSPLGSEIPPTTNAPGSTPSSTNTVGNESRRNDPAPTGLGTGQQAPNPPPIVTPRVNPKPLR